MIMEHVTFDAVLAMAKDAGDGWRKAIVELTSGQTLFYPGSTKKVLTGRGRYVFMIHPSSVDLIQVPPGCRHVYLEGAR